MSMLAADSNSHDRTTSNVAEPRPTAAERSVLRVAAAAPRWGAFSHTPFAVMWVATTCSFTGLAISDTASAWLMTSLNPDPRAVTLVQVASTLPMFLCTVPAGVLADMVAPRRFLIILETFVTALMGLFGAVIFFHWLNPVCLLPTNFALSIAWSLTTPAWLSITPLLVPPRDLADANAANSVGYNISRAVGPIVAGLALAQTGTRRTLLDIRGRRFDVDRGIGLVASPQENQLALYAGAIYRRAADRISACGQKQASAGHDDPNGRCLSLRFRLSGVAAAHCAPPGGAARATILQRLAGGRQRRRRARLSRA